MLRNTTHPANNTTRKICAPVTLSHYCSVRALLSSKSAATRIQVSRAAMRQQNRQATVGGGHRQESESNPSRAESPPPAERFVINLDRSIGGALDEEASRGGCSAESRSRGKIYGNLSGRQAPHRPTFVGARSMCCVCVLIFLVLHKHVGDR